MKLFEMEGFLRVKCIPRDLKVNETNAEYLVRKFAEADARCAELAAENAGLKQFPDQIVGFIGKLGSSEIGSETKEKIEAAAKKIKTPATDAFLAEVRAQGVEMFAIEWGGHDSPYGLDAYNFADKIRKGVQS